LVSAEFDGGDDSVVRKVMADLAAKGGTATETDVRAKMDELLAVAAAQVKAGT
jgi:hypothetical protein